MENYHRLSEVNVVSFASLLKVAGDRVPAMVSYKNEVLPFYNAADF